MPVPTTTLISSDSESEDDIVVTQQETIDWERRRQEQEAERRRVEAQRVGSPFKHPWWYSFSGMGPTPRSLVEWLTVDISKSIRTKPDWETKYKNPEIVAKWTAEIKEQCQDRTKFIDEVIEYIFKELEWYERVEKDLGTFHVACDDKILYSDNAIDNSLKKEFTTEVAKLVESYGGNYDYHPGSNNAVIDLVHPSLFTVQYDKTPILKDGSLEIVKFTEEIKNAKAHVSTDAVSEKFQWIPALMTKNSSSGQFEFTSYINNLHPVQYKELYNSIGKIFNATIPGLNCTLTRYASSEHIRVPIPSYEAAYNEQYEIDRDALEAQLRAEEEEGNDPYDWDRYSEFEAGKAKYLLDFFPKWEHDPVFDKPIDLNTFDNLKVIVKLANIELTPENPSYGGGAWHVEGTINEDIVATVLYYYDMENISESRLSFRTGFEDPEYEQGDSVYTTEIFGIKDEDKMVKELGSVEAKQDRIAIFPNMYQHHVDPFELTDKSKPGYRKILCFFIVDPYNHRVLSTDQVPPQQKEWWDDSTLDYLFPGNLKTEILQLKGDVSWPLTLREAKETRSVLMEERSAPDEDDDDYDGAFTRRFSLCEH
ncbi:hypothetical protein SBY92_005204 [Candida maltosa Xu316]|uniref:Uncharacterized protein n=1 Tax=Candida maltosa (strain Xu316) TaxID=1245528 RepID=M3JVG8_CANMX|nr:Putative uncharacterized protein (Putative uncharacterized protein) [Candida maltosa Xu316]